MAPALSVAPGEPHSYETAEDSEKPIPLRRRALASVDNFASHMEEDDMGLQNQPSLAKDSQEMEQILVDLGSSDIVQADLLQAIKTFESGGDGLSTGDADGIFPLSGFDLADNAESESDAAEDKVRLMQARLERRCAFLQRRLRILQARSIGKRISEEAAQTFEKCIRGARKDGVGRPVGLKAFLKRIETTATLQASAASKPVPGPAYPHTVPANIDLSKTASVGIASGSLQGLEETASSLRSNLLIVQRQLDSDATASSSGAESNDETVTYNNPHQQQMPIEKRALWSWLKARSSIASRWCWLQAQVQELEYKIRQHNDLHKQVREAKGPVEFEGEPVGYEGSLPGSSDAADGPATETCARVRPLRRETFKKRKLLQMHNLHIATTKAAKPSDIRCSCEYRAESCSVCTGRASPTEPAPPDAAMSHAQRIARLDPGYHPVLSDARDILPSVHMPALLSKPWVRARGRGRAPTRPPPTTTPTKNHKKHPIRLKRGRPPLSRKIRERDREDETSTSSHERSRGRPSTESRARRQSYDIDNIVIPQSVAANTRPQILTYKEIITPKWRVLEIPDVSLNNGVSKRDSLAMESEDEDISEAAVAARHVRAEVRERSRFASRPRRARPAPEIEEPLDGPLPELPAPEPQVQQPNEIQHETVRPYSPRQFPLPDDAYLDMLSDMPDGYRATTPEDAPPPDDDTSSLSPMSVTAFDGDDPDDMEWDPSVEKTEKRKSAFR